MAIGDDWNIDTTKLIIEYTGGFTNGIPNNIYSMNALYTWLQDEMDEPTKMQFGNPMTAQTPKEYTLNWPWFISDTSMKATFEGALTTSGWTRSEGSAIGILLVQYSAGTDPVASDIGKQIVDQTDADEGMLVGYDTTRKVLWIRPDTYTSADSFDDTGGTHTLAVTGGTGSVTQAAVAGESGKSVWACIYTLGSIASETEIYIIQANNFTEVASPALTKIAAWWHEDVDFSSADGVETGHIDIPIKVKEIDNLIDEGKLLIMARQYSKTFAHYEATITGGRTPIPLATQNDLDNTSGYRQFISDADSGSWTQADVGSIIRKDGDNRNKAIITSLSGTSPDWTVQYYLIGDQDDFANNDVIEDEGETKTMTIAGAPTNVGPATETSIDVTFGGTTGDIDEDGSNEYYSATLDCNSTALSTVYERCKYLSRRGNNTDIDQGSQTIYGEFYKGIGDYYVPYDGGSQDDPFNEGEDVSWDSGNGTGIITAKQDRGTNEGFVIIRQVRGTTLADGQTLTGGSSGHTATVDEDGGSDPVGKIAESTGSPFGSFAGGKFFFARGILPSNVLQADASNYQCIDSEGNVVDPPTKVTVEMTGLTSDSDRVTILEVTGAGTSIVKKDQYGLAAGNFEGDSTIEVDSTILDDTAGKTTGGTIICRYIDANEETMYRYSSWSGTTFTLSTGVSGTCEASGCTTTNLRDTSGNFNSADVKVGDVIRDTTNDEYGYITYIVNDDNLTVTEKATSWASAGYQNNRLDRNYNGAQDTAYASFIPQSLAEASSVSSTLVHSSDINVMARGRYSSGTGKILPFQQTGLTIGSSGLSVAIIRTDDNIAS